jgi:3-oxoacyl-[acyl-carrier-protein] synthase II
LNDPIENIVITGVGMTTSLGLWHETIWARILCGDVGMGPMSAMESPLPPGRDGGQAEDLPPQFAPDLPREIRYLKWTIAAALRNAGVLESSPYFASRCACLLGTTLHGMRAAGRHFRSGDFSELQQFLAGNTLDLATKDFALAGMSATTCSACSSSLGSIALAVTLLQTGQADLVVAGGYDTISEYVYGGFSSLRLVAEGPLRPFSKGRQGMKLAEGYGIVVLERATDAKRRGATVLATILGWGESADAHHLTQPHPQGDGAARAIREAIARAGLTAADIDLIAAHATGTPDNDAGEYAAFCQIFGERLPQIPVVGFKSHLGHTLGGAGAVELILSAMALRDQIIPACANVKPEDVEFPNLHLATGQPVPAKLRTTLNTSLGFGGANTCVILGLSPLPRYSGGEGQGEGGILRREVSGSEYKDPLTLTLSPGVPGERGQDVFITGIGVIVPGIIGNDALLARLTTETNPAWERDAGSVHDSALEGLLNARRVRRMSDYVKLTLATATLALRDAGVTDTTAFAEDCAAVLGSTHGSSNYSVAYYSQIVKEGLIAANPMLFAEAVPNAGAAQLSLMLALNGACQTVIGTRTAGLDALALAAARIASGVWDHAIVSAGEEYCPLVNDAYRHCGVGATAEGSPPFTGERGFTSGAGAVTFILESRASIERRGGKARGRIEASTAARGNRSDVVETVSRVLAELKHPAHVLSSACGTWIDRAEAAALRQTGTGSVSAIYGHIAETFSASPLIALAAVLLSGKMPRLLGDGRPKGAVKAASSDIVHSVAAICTDFTGTASGIRVKMTRDE